MNNSMPIQHAADTMPNEPGANMPLFIPSGRGDILSGNAKYDGELESVMDVVVDTS